MFTRFASDSWMSPECRKSRFLLRVFFVNMWLLKALLRLTFPEAVSLNLFMAPLLDFIFGIASSPLLFLYQKHGHNPTFHFGLPFDFGNIL